MTRRVAGGAVAVRLEVDGLTVARAEAHEGEAVADVDRRLALRLDPAERFLLLATLLDDVKGDADGEIVRAVGWACMAVVRHAQGRITEREALFAVERARAALVGGRS